MKVTYDPSADAVSIRLRASRVCHTEAIDADGDLLADYDEHERVVGIEILNASEHLDDPQAMQFLILRQPEPDQVLTGTGA